MTLAELKQHFITELETIYDKDESEQIFLIYLEDKFGLQYTPHNKVEKLDVIFSDLDKLKSGIPIQHITEKAFFYDDFFFVNQHTLIPRPETEELIEIIKNDYVKNPPSSIIDLGTGSGCIPISLKKIFPNANVSALDVSEKALEVAAINAKNLNTDILLIHQNLLEDFNLDRKFEVIISNPPYIRNLEKEEMHKNVLDFEPHLALFVEDDNALIFYERVIAFAENHLTENGVIYCEINQYLGEETKTLFLTKYKNVQLIKDISGNDRMIKATNN
ncbi:release factor glutamine methyltransferase [Chishuiella changwenlii]|uniref:peptide chain release factor N(5)-glutamine methyltransferase n=1 Tax=Chishuiella changwenlii TaxID=1434701 RepID=A0A1M6X273_9FLAO|nr:peptide chain release factor N(5)-glutamine methyltransferase [Chishuiella changwenlii]GGE98411.1 release factor glutamine methyltransferase [Chishuiella changwenlii]SHK99905.1 release factor glutamine methyltransferase [Chishuiella changwenlii]